MLNFKTSLLAATVFAGVAATPAFADTALPLPAPGLPTSTVSGVTFDGDAALHGAGATSVQNVLVRVANALGSFSTQLGNGQPAGAGATNNGSFSTVANLSYTGGTGLVPNGVVGSSSAATAPNSNAIQPNFQAKYVGTGSGFGRKAWYLFGDVFDGGLGTANSATVLAQSSGHPYVDGVPNPFVTTGQATFGAGPSFTKTQTPDNHWSHLQFAISDAPLSQSELNLYNAAGNAKDSAGAAIQFPLFVLPVTVVYATKYGHNTVTGDDYFFNAQYAGNFNGTIINTLKLDTPTLCGIFNGDIKNWNDAKIQALNGKKVVNKVNVGISLGDAKDTDWATRGAPIRLVGRLDNSGTTDVFTRHLAAVCNTTNGYTGTNKYTKNAESLPYDKVANNGVNFTSVRADTNYKPSASPSKFAGTTNLVSGDYFDGTNIVVAGGGAGTPTATPTSGNDGTGLYLLANGGSKLAGAISLAPDYVNGNVKLNGKVGYISADNIQPSVDAKAGIVAAALVNHKDAKTYVPTIKNSLLAFGDILPPQTTDKTTGNLDASDSRTITDGANARNNPLAWTEVLYLSGATLADPTKGYPITGTTQFLGYTCYATKGNREQIVALLGALTGQLKKNSTGAAIPAAAFNNVAPASLGIADQANIAVVPAPWQKAIVNTFLTQSATDTNAAALNLWIQDKVLPVFGQVLIDPSKPKGGKTLGIKTDVNANPSCASVPGA